MDEIDDALVEKMAAALEREFGSFCDPQNPAMFWPYTARHVLAVLPDATADLRARLQAADDRLAEVIAERDAAREECGYEKRMRKHGREQLDLFVRLKREREAERDEVVEALRLTHEYVGPETLPPISGWSWFDAMSKYAPDYVAALLKPKPPATEGLPTADTTGRDQ